MNGKVLVFAALGAAMVIVGALLRKKNSALPAPAPDADGKTVKADKRRRLLPKIIFWAGVWLAVSEIITLVFGPSQKKFEVEIFAPMVRVGGLQISQSVITGWILIAVLTVLALLFRFVAFPRFTQKPRGLQNVVELAVEELSKYCESRLSHPLGQNLAAYMFTIAVYMIACASVELVGQRAPTSDITMTLSMALITFILINYYGIRQKGLRGRIQSMAQPTPIILPIKILSDIATPVSLACRLFGNMLGGMIVMELLYYALGNFAFGAPAAVGLYFNVFHPLIQTFIFITLSLTFINEAIE